MHHEAGMVAPGDIINERYRLDRRIGRGGFAEVFAATDELLGRQVAVKVLRPDLAAEPDFLARFGREARAVAALDHPHILAVHDYGESDGLAYLVLPYVPGGTLDDRLHQEGAPSFTEAARYLQEAAAALDYAHAQGILHRDIKPA